MFDRGEGTPGLGKCGEGGLVKVVMRLSEAKQPPNPLIAGGRNLVTSGDLYLFISVARTLEGPWAEALEEASTSEVRPSGEWDWFADFARRRMVVVRAFLEGERQPEACENDKVSLYQGAVEMRGMLGQGLLQSELLAVRAAWLDDSVGAIVNDLFPETRVCLGCTRQAAAFHQGVPSTAFVTILDLDKSSESVEAAGVWQLGPGARLSADERCHGWRALWRLAACIDDEIFTAMWCKKSETERALDNAEGEEWEFWAAKYLKQEKEELRKWGF
ncbi:hypothetical protein B0H15DRAFT_958705 [Mycena belliarum]|uniref:Uncharacterized protein n=1 Tax=Mycena belliarum TaxID=1033014 RepID=A0AAD6XKB6_9AGAR|nr:hypothetical protein B0H15DRAFT_958705 [Mycena belliae]